MRTLQGSSNLKLFGFLTMAKDGNWALSDRFREIPRQIELLKQ